MVVLDYMGFKGVVFIQSFIHSFIITIMYLVSERKQGRPYSCCGEVVQGTYVHEGGSGRGSG